MRAAVLGAGVVGAGWTARFALHGWDVCVHDPAGRQEQVEKVLIQARSSLDALYDCPLPATGSVTFADDIETAIAGTDWVQESLPEQLHLKRNLYAEVADHLPPEALLASSTSGFKPSVLAVNLPCAERFLVCHPFQPVYLLPAVELVPGQLTSPATVAAAAAALESVGMSPLPISREIEAHVADRLLEAMWREALWLVKDGIATTAEIDAVIRNGFGLRWAQMGLFETYRIAGGDAGMHHFLAQFGPALKWPWSRLTDVPEMDAELIRLITAQSDAQAGIRSVNELAAERDRNLVAVLRALKSTGGGAGRVVAEFEARLNARTSAETSR